MGRKTVAALAILAALAAGMPADAAGLGAAYGNTEGCHYARTGESSGADEFFLLNDDGVTTAVSYCAFNGTLTASKTGFTATGTCSAEGESDEHAESIDILSEAGGYVVAFKDGTRWGPLPKCH